MSHEDARAVHEALTGLPVLDRMAALCVSVIAAEPREPNAIAILIEVALMMARHLPPSQRASVIWQLNAAAQELEARWN